MRTRTAAVLVLLAAVPATAIAASERDTSIRRALTGESGGTRIEAKVVLPATWKPVRGSTASRLRVTAGGTPCRFTIAFATQMAGATGGTAEEHAAQRVPGTGGYVLDAGTRGRSAWRVVRVRVSRGSSPMRAIRVDPASGSRWRETTATATPGPDSECHAGVYRESIGPSIGDAMATVRGRWFTR